MTRVSVIVVLLCTFAGVIYYFVTWQEQQTLLEPTELTVIYAAKDIKHGQTIKETDVEERWMETAKIPPGADQSIVFAIGSTAQRDIKRGEMLMDGDHVTTWGVSVHSAD